MEVKVRLQKNGQYMKICPNMETVGAFVSDLEGIAPVCAKIIIYDGVKEYDTYYPHNDLPEICESAYRRGKGQEKYDYYEFETDNIGWSDIAALCFRGVNPDDKDSCISYDTNIGEDGTYEAYIVSIEPERVDFGNYTLVGKVAAWVSVVNEQEVCALFNPTGFEDEIAIYQNENKFILAGRGLKKYEDDYVST